MLPLIVDSFKVTFNHTFSIYYYTFLEKDSVLANIYFQITFKWFLKSEWGREDVESQSQHLLLKLWEKLSKFSHNFIQTELCLTSLTQPSDVFMDPYCQLGVLFARVFQCYFFPEAGNVRRHSRGPCHCLKVPDIGLMYESKLILFRETWSGHKTEKQRPVWCTCFR